MFIHCAVWTLVLMILEKGWLNFLRFRSKTDTDTDSKPENLDIDVKNEADRVLASKNEIVHI